MSTLFRSPGSRIGAREFPRTTDLFVPLAFCVLVTVCSCGKQPDHAMRSPARYRKSAAAPKSSPGEYAAEMDRSRKSWEILLAANDQRISAFMWRINNPRKADRSDCLYRIGMLGRRNTLLKTRLEACRPENKAAWTLFRKQFTSELLQLESSFNDFSIFYLQ